MPLFDRLKTDLAEIWNQAHVVGKWVRLDFNVPPLQQVRAKLKDLGFDWNCLRRWRQHPSAVQSLGSRDDPRDPYNAVAGAIMATAPRPMGDPPRPVQAATAAQPAD